MDTQQIEKIIADVIAEIQKETDDKETKEQVQGDANEVSQAENIEHPTYPLLKSISPNKPILITEETLRKIAPNGGIALVDGKYIITPSARDFIRRKDIKLKPVDTVTQRNFKELTHPEIEKTVAIGSDHRGFTLKEFLKDNLLRSGYKIIDVGTDTPESCDYPDYASAVAEKVANKEVLFGIAIDSAGIGSSIAANKISGIRAAVCWDMTSAEQARIHNDANVLCLGADTLAPAKALAMAKKFLEARFIPNERYSSRIEKTKALEKQ